MPHLEVERFIYIGDSIIKYNLRKGDVFDKIPSNIDDKDVLVLIIPIDKLQEAQREMKNPLSLYSIRLKKLREKKEID